MTVFRVEKNKDYTVMANHHLRNRDISLKAKGLLSLMLSLPDNWDYTLKGLAAISKDGVDSVRSTIQELEAGGYVTRQRLRSEGGRLSQTQYTIFEVPQGEPKKSAPKPKAANLGQPMLENPTQEKPVEDNPAQINTKKINTQESNTNSSILQDDDDLDYISGCEENKNPLPPVSPEERREYQEFIRENIDYQALCRHHSREEVDEIAGIIEDVLCSRRPSYKINREDIPTAVVKSRFMSLNRHHITCVLEALKEVKTPVTNTYGYIITSLFNVKTTMNQKINMDINKAEAQVGSEPELKAPDEAQVESEPELKAPDEAQVGSEPELKAPDETQVESEPRSRIPEEILFEVF